MKKVRSCELRLAGKEERIIMASNYIILWERERAAVEEGIRKTGFFIFKDTT